MKKIIAILSLFICLGIGTYAQSNAFVDYGDGSGIPGITESPLKAKEWAKLYKTTEAEDWKKLAKLTFKALKKFPEDNNIEKGLVRYMHLYAISGLLSKGKITKALALDKAKQHITKKVTVPPHTVCASPENNCYTYEAEKLRITLSNYKDNFKHLISIISPEEKVSLLVFGDKDIYSFGRLESVATDSEKTSGFDLMIGGAQIFARPKKK